ncbi:threonine--tRNA ligase [bacterium]|nr:threonine--tRNA ligase [bacterium]
MSREDVVKNIESDFFLLKQDGEEISFNVSDYEQKLGGDYPYLIKMINFEILGKKPGVAPPSIKIMRQMELIDYEPASDSGHFRFYPKGQLVYSLMEDWASEIALNRFGAMQIDTPILYDWNHKAIRSQGESFHERHYSISTPGNKEKEFVLRFAGDFGLFCMVGDANLSYRHLPLRIYEFSRSYRYEKSGELVGLRRLRGFSMPDIHSFCPNIETAWDEYKELYRNYADLADVMKVDYAIVFRVVKKFYEDYKSQIVEMLRYSKKPGIVEVLSDMKHYWAVKHEFQGLDSVGGACQTSTVQLDVEDAEKYGITYTTPDNNQEGCTICHSSIGAIERWIYLILEASQKMEVPQLPLWLAPIQVRIIPVSEKHVNRAVEIAGILRKKKIRAEVDDRNETVGKRVKLANNFWIPFILVIGDNEIGKDELTVKERGRPKNRVVKINNFVRLIRQKTKGMPFRQSTLPLLVSRQPIFYG